jgi:hypothetical protein
VRVQGKCAAQKQAVSKSGSEWQDLAASGVVREKIKGIKKTPAGGGGVCSIYDFVDLLFISIFFQIQCPFLNCFLTKHNKSSLLRLK